VLPITIDGDARERTEVRTHRARVTQVRARPLSSWSVWPISAGRG